MPRAPVHSNFTEVEWCLKARHNPHRGHAQKAVGIKYSRPLETDLTHVGSLISLCATQVLGQCDFGIKT